MDDELKKAVRKAQATSNEAFVKERSAFKKLLLTNPNYFGNLTDSVFKSVLSISGNTFYEELGCVGYQPQQRQLEGVVYLYQPSGYGSDLCGPGSSEFVRFYLSFDHGATWVDQGMTSFQAYNLPAGTEGSKRLEYAVSLPAHPPLRLCVADLLVRVRAILSWNNPPPANQPNWTPIWGNVRDQQILIEPLRLVPPKHLFEAAKIKVPPVFEQILDLEHPIATKTKALAASELAELYAGKGVPVHRFAFKELHAFAMAASPLAAESFLTQLAGIQIEPGILDLLFPSDGNTSYEELRCIGLDPNHPDTLVGVIEVKKGSGYSGGPCTNGSKEFVTFWADFDHNGNFETCLGTASVTVYDVPGAAPQSVYYAVRLPVDLSAHRKNCHDGANVVRIRAILSWNVPVPCANPNQVPTWGNREETLINIAPIAQAAAGKIAILGGIPVSMIDGITGLTTPDAVFATNNQAPDALLRPCPFAARVSVQGAPLPGYTYQVDVSPDNSVFTPVLTDLVVTDQFGNTSPHKANSVTKRFDYLPFNANVNALLAEWDSSGDAKWYVRLSVYDAGGVFQGSDTHVIQLDNTWPEVSIEITTGLGNCGKFLPGEPLGGRFVARDTYLSNYSVGVEPNINPAPVGVPVPSAGHVSTAPAPGDSWTLDTTEMDACGYVVRVVAVDRAIVNSQSVGHVSSDSVGFCLELPENG